MMTQEHALARLSDEDRKLLTPAVLARFGDAIERGDVTAVDVADAEKRRLKALGTLRDLGNLTDLEWKFVRYLQRFEGRPRTYLQIANHLWGTPDRPVTSKHLQMHDGYASPFVSHIHVLASTVRAKLEIDTARHQHLATRRGVGYSWHDLPPSLTDGIDYQKLYAEVARMRAQLMVELGYDVDEAQLPPNYRGTPELGPEYPLHEGDVLHASSEKAEG